MCKKNRRFGGEASRLVHGIEDAARAEMDLLCFRPPAEGTIDSDQIQFGELGAVFGQGFLGPRTVVVPANQVLGLLGLQKLQVGLSDLPRLPGVHVPVDH